MRYNGTDILYTDDKGEFILTGAMIDTKTRTDLTEQRVEKLLAIDFDKLPLKDALLIKQGNDITPSTPEDCAKLLAADLARYAAIVKKAGIKLE